MKTRVVFIMPMLLGHVNRTIKIGKILEERGHEVFYAGGKQLLRFTIKNGFRLHVLSTLPFTINEKAATLKGLKKWRSNLQHQKNDNVFSERQKDIGRLVDELKPGVIFVDEFNYSDLIFLYSFKDSIRINILQSKYGMYYQATSPPSNVYAFPGRGSSCLWKKIFLKDRTKQLIKKILYLGYSSGNQLKRAVKRFEIPGEYGLNTRKIFSPGFKSFPELFLSCPEIDFGGVTLLPWQNYLSPCVDLERRETISQELLNFLERKNKDPANKLIYCSLGTVAEIHLKKDEQDYFFANIRQLASMHSDWFFIISLGIDYKNTHPQTFHPNVLILDFGPQLYILRQALVFYTHCGLNSIFEAIYLAVPMLLFPLNQHWDQPGNAARMVHHGLGIMADIRATARQIEDYTIELLQNEYYRKRISLMAESLSGKYTDDYTYKQLEKSMS